MVFNTYYIISVIYNNDIGDKSIIAETIKHGINDFISSSTYKQTKKELEKGVEEIEKMIKNINEKH